MGRLEPISSGSWDVRSRDPKPGIRVFGAFAATDLFVALDWRPRSRRIAGFDKKPLLDDEIEWQLAMLEAEQRWDNILPRLPRIVGKHVSDYVSEAAHSVGD